MIGAAEPLSSAEYAKGKSADQVLRRNLLPLGLKNAARHLGLSPKLLERWCTPTSDASLRDDPLSRLSLLYRLTQDQRLLEWLCQRCNGYFVSPRHEPGPGPASALTALQKVVSEFAGLLASVTDLVARQGQISASESVEIRRIWQSLKSVGEAFVVATESGRFGAVSRASQHEPENSDVILHSPTSNDSPLSAF